MSFHNQVAGYTSSALQTVYVLGEELVQETFFSQHADKDV
jgi:hypothetical protein